MLALYLINCLLCVCVFSKCERAGYKEKMCEFVRLFLQRGWCGRGGDVIHSTRICNWSTINRLKLVLLLLLRFFSLWISVSFYLSAFAFCVYVLRDMFTNERVIHYTLFQFFNTEFRFACLRCVLTIRRCISTENSMHINAMAVHCLQWNVARWFQCTRGW